MGADNNQISQMLQGLTIGAAGFRDPNQGSQQLQQFLGQQQQNERAIADQQGFAKFLSEQGLIQPDQVQPFSNLPVETQRFGVTQAGQNARTKALTTRQANTDARAEETLNISRAASGRAGAKFKLEQEKVAKGDEFARQAEADLQTLLADNPNLDGNTKILVRQLQGEGRFGEAAKTVLNQQDPLSIDAVKNDVFRGRVPATIEGFQQRLLNSPKFFPNKKQEDRVEQAKAIAAQQFEVVSVPGEDNRSRFLGIPLGFTPERTVNLPVKGQSTQPGAQAPQLDPSTRAKLIEDLRKAGKIQ